MDLFFNLCFELSLFSSCLLLGLVFALLSFVFRVWVEFVLVFVIWVDALIDVTVAASVGASF